MSDRERADLLAFGPFRLSRMQRRLEKDGLPVRIGSRALDILVVLAERAGDVISKEDLLSLVWPDTSVDEIALRVHIASLRKALGDGQTGARYITNVPGRGYCFVSPLSRSPEGPAGSSRPEDYRATLPAPLKRIIGREDSITDASRLVPAKRFLTLVGAGGVGKTTVAVAVAHALVDSFQGNVRFVDLGSLLDEGHVQAAVASAVGVAAVAKSGLVAFLRDERVLLVLDSCEHVISAVAPLAEELIARTEGVHILATSREPLRVEGEHVLRLCGLEVPPSSDTITAEAALAFPAIQLFMERAAAAGAGLTLSDVDAPLVAEICKKLDGIALAIEFAAGRVEAYGLRGTVALLGNRFKLLWHGRRTAVPRHRTLSSMLDWSYKLLDEVERRTLRRLSVLVGLFTLDAVAAVACADSSDDAEAAVDALASLVEKSLLSADSSGNTVRYRLLDTTRAYALERLTEAGERDATSRRLVAYLCHALDADNALSGPHGAPAAAYLGSVRAGLEWAFSERGDAAMGAVLIAVAAPMYMELSLLNECHGWATAALASLDPAERGTRLEMDIQAAIGITSMFTRGNGPDVREALDRGIGLADSVNEPHEQLRLLGALHILLTRTAEWEDSLATGRRAEAVAARMPDDPAARLLAEWMVATSEHLLGDQTSAELRARSALNPSPVSRSTSMLYFGFDHRIRALIVLGRSLWLLGRADDALQVAASALRDAELIGQPTTTAIALIYTFSVYLWSGDLDTAERVVDRLLSHAEKHSLAPYHAVALGQKGELLVKRADVAGIPLLRRAIDTLQAGRHVLLQSTFYTALAHGLAIEGRFADALTAIDAALAETTRNHGRSFDLPEMLRVKGQLLEASRAQDPSEAQAHFVRALESASVQGALGWELRAAMALARLWSRQGRIAAARDALAGRYERFTQGFGTADLKEAKKLLAELGS